MFWGISLEAGKRYSQTVEKSFHISMAALNASQGVEKGAVTVMAEVEKACYPLCTLHPERIPQQALDYVFTEGEEVLFYTEGDLDVHLTGYLIDDPNPMEYSSDKEVESAADSSASTSDEEKQTTKKDKSKKQQSESEESNFQSLISELNDLNQDNKDVNVNMWLPRSARIRQKRGSLGEETTVEGSLTEKLLCDDSDESEDNEWQPGQKRKLSKNKEKSDGEENTRKERKLNDSNMDSKNNKSELNSSPSRQIVSPSKSRKSMKGKDVKAPNGLPENSTCGDAEVDGRNCSQNEISLSKEDKITMDGQNTLEKSQHNRKELPGGTIIEDVVKGQGKKAKRGKQVSLYYKGMLKKTNKEFQSCVSGNPLTFRLGEGEVIKGWDVGIEGMQVGGKRKLIIPPSQGYGSKGRDPDIPQNSTLTFLIELLKVH